MEKGGKEQEQGDTVQDLGALSSLACRNSKSEDRQFRRSDPAADPQIGESKTMPRSDPGST